MSVESKLLVLAEETLAEITRLAGNWQTYKGKGCGCPQPPPKKGEAKPKGWSCNGHRSDINEALDDYYAKAGRLRALDRPLVDALSKFEIGV